MTPAAIVAFNGVLFCAAASDLRRYRIPNILPALLALAALALAFPATAEAAMSRAASVAMVSLIAGGLWLRGLLGGGDLKLLAACAAWIPLGGLAAFALALGIASCVQGLTALAWMRAAGTAPLGSIIRNRLPYGVSIAAAGLAWSLLQQSIGG
jgi:prepilin peptidase CpaA